MKFLVLFIVSVVVFDICSGAEGPCSTCDEDCQQECTAQECTFICMKRDDTISSLCECAGSSLTISVNIVCFLAVAYYLFGN